MLAALIGGPEVRTRLVSHYFIAMNRGKAEYHRGSEEARCDRNYPQDGEVLRCAGGPNYRPGCRQTGLGYDEARN